jgi:hypothetical protein
VGISTIKKFTSGRGWGMTPQGLTYKAFNLPSYPDHKYIYGLGVGISTIKRFTSGRGFLSFVVSEKCVILKICTFSINDHDFTRKKQ